MAVCEDLNLDLRHPHKKSYVAADTSNPRAARWSQEVLRGLLAR